MKMRHYASSQGGGFPLLRRCGSPTGMAALSHSPVGKGIMAELEGLRDLGKLLQCQEDAADALGQSGLGLGVASTQADRDNLLNSAVLV